MKIGRGPHLKWWMSRRSQTGESESEDDLAEDDSNLDGTFDASYSTYMAAIASGNVYFQASGVEPCR